MSQTKAQLVGGVGFSTADSLTVHNGLAVTGVITATSFAGNISGDATGLTGSPNITVTNITASGNVTVGGTLTYEDVTNIDAIGIVTARSGINITGAGMTVTGISTFRGDVQVADKIVHLDDSNTAIRFPAADTFTVETGGSERVRVDSSGNFGIGASPSHVLDVTTTGDRVRFKAGSGDCDIELSSIAGRDYLISSKTDGSLTFFDEDASAERMRITSSGNLGVGTASPSFKLSAAGGGISAQTSSNDGALVFLPLGASNENRIYSRSSVTGTGNKDLAFRIGDTERLRIDSSGRLLLGTNSVSYHTTAVFEGNSGSATNQGQIYINRGETSVTSGEILGIIRFGATGDLRGADIRGVGDGTWATDDYPTSLQFLTTSDGGNSPTERVRITSAGRMGINQTSPTAFIHAKSGANDGTVIGTFEGATNNKLDIKFNSGGPALNVTAGDPLVFEIGGTEAARIDSSRRLLLGTTTEGESTADDLTIATSGHTGITLRGSTSDNCNIYFSDGTSGADEYRGIVRYAHSLDSLDFWSNASLRMRVDSSGRLLLGTTTEGNANANDLTIGDAGSTAGITLRSANDGFANIYFSDAHAGAGEFAGWIQYGHSDNYLALATNNAERLRIASSGQIGLGGANYGTSGQVITSNGSGSAPTWQDAGGGSWNLISTVTASGSASSVNITGTSSTYNQYCIIGRNIKVSSTDWYYAQFLNSNGSSLTTYANSWYSTVSSSASSMSSNQDTSYFRPGRGGDSTDDRSDFWLFFNSTHESSTETFIYQWRSVNSIADVIRFMNGGGGVHQSFTNISGLKVYVSSGTITGTFQLYGIS